jgi:hypothetical protein
VSFFPTQNRQQINDYKYRTKKFIVHVHDLMNWGIDELHFLIKLDGYRYAGVYFNEAIWIGIN